MPVKQTGTGELTADVTTRESIPQTKLKLKSENGNLNNGGEPQLNGTEIEPCLSLCSVHCATCHDPRRS